MPVGNRAEVNTPLNVYKSKNVTDLTPEQLAALVVVERNKRAARDDGLINSNKMTGTKSDGTKIH